MKKAFVSISLIVLFLLLALYAGGAILESAEQECLSTGRLMC